MSDNYNLSDISWRCAKCKNKYSDYCYNNCMAIHNKLFPSWNNIKYCMPIISVFNLGNMRKTEMYVTDKDFKIIKDIPKTVIEK